MPNPPAPPKLTRLKLSGFKSIEQEDVNFTSLDLLIGPNGAGKSNLIGFLKLISFMLSSDSGLATYVAKSGGASALLHDGPKKTKEIEAEITITTHQGENQYRFRLGYAADDTFIFLEEQCRFSRRDRPTRNERWISFGAGHRSPQILTRNEAEVGKTRHVILHLLRGLAVFQFHDTSDESAMKRKGLLSDCQQLRSDGGNLAAVLFDLRDKEPLSYRRIVETIRLIAPYFDDFIFEPEYGRLLLRWRETGSEVAFGASQISDGTLRAIALVTLLLQPPKRLPPILVIDEPELGLHPFAIRIIADAIKAASVDHQCLIATQSAPLLNEFEAGSVLVVERPIRGSIFRRLDGESLASWLEDYGLGELWGMNLLGGRPEPMAAQ